MRPPAQKPPDLLLRGGHVIDGSGSERRRADVLTCAGTIAAVGPDLPVRGLRGEPPQVIDVSGLVVTPGFLDTHSHSDLMILSQPDLPMKVRQGITLDVLGQDGLSVVPVRDDPAAVEQVRRQLAGLDGDPPLQRDFHSVADYLDRIDRGGAAIHGAFLVPHGMLRGYVMGLDNRPPTAEEMAGMRALLRDGMLQGALGISTGLIYPPCCYADTDELCLLGEEVGSLGGIFVVHLRSESDQILAAVDEMIEVARRGKVHVHISHFKIAGRRNSHLAEALCARLRAAQQEGLLLTADQYPYTAGSTMLGAILPPWAHDGGVNATLARLGDPAVRGRMRAALEHPGPSSWDNFWAWTGPAGIVIADVPSGNRGELVGKTLQEAAAMLAADPLELAFDLLRDERMGVAMISHSQDEAVVERLMREPYVNFCTDGLLGGRPHPRAYGSVPRVLSRYVRERGLFSLEEAVRKGTRQAALSMHLPDRGLLREGLVADVVAFDPALVADRATFADPVQFPLGIAHVVVGGELVVRDGQQTGARPGRAVRGAACQAADRQAPDRGGA